MAGKVKHSLLEDGTYKRENTRHKKKPVRHMSKGYPSWVKPGDVAEVEAWCGERVKYNPPTSQRVLTDNPKAVTCAECESEYGLHLLSKL